MTSCLERFGKKILASDEGGDQFGGVYGDEDKDTQKVVNVVSMQAVSGGVGLSRGRSFLSGEGF